MRRIGTTALVATAAIGSVLTAPSPAYANAAARSVDVYYHNNTGCTFKDVSQEIHQGIWTIDPELQIPAGQTSHVRTESDSFLTGTEAALGYTAADCGLAGKKVRFTWHNPFVGQNDYGFAGTDAAFGSYFTGGNGDKTTVHAYFVVT